MKIQVLKILGCLFFGAVLGLVAVAQVNRVVDKPAVMAPETLRGKTPLFKQAAPVIEKACLNCHSSKTQLPWYATLPPAKQIIENNIKEGRKEIDLEKVLFTPGKKPSEKALKHIRSVIRHGEMPPIEYSILHWSGFLSATEKKAILDWVDEEQAKNGKGFEPLPLTVKVDSAKADLGKRLFHDTRLSGDRTISCATCHDLKRGGTDQMPSSIGIRGQRGPISAPTVFNSNYNLSQFWDGRAADLKEQALGPVTNPLEMGGDWAKILPVLNADAVYAADFKKIYGRAATKDDVANAIAEFEKTLVTPNSPFDRYLRGDKNAMTEKQLLGFKLFNEIGCLDCHNGPALGGKSFEKMGRRHDYFTDRGNPTSADLGLFNHTKKESDKHYFKVPILRNITETHPYFHDGSVQSLDEAVRKMAYYQVGRKLSQDEIDAIVAYLHSLTGEYEGKSLSSDSAKK